MLEKFVDDQFMELLFIILTVKINEYYFNIEAVIVVV